MLNLKVKFEAAPSGNYFVFNDITGASGTGAYGDSMDYGDIQGVRLELNPDTKASTDLIAGQLFEQYKVYVKSSTNGLSEIDSKFFSYGDQFIPRSASFSVPSGDTWTWTGFYAYPQTWLPTLAQNQLNLPLSELGMTSISDNIYLGTYEVYIDQYIASFASTEGVKYRVQSGAWSYNGSTYYAGEVFVAKDSNTVTCVSGVINWMYASVDFFASIDFNSRTKLYSAIIDNYKHINRMAELNKISIEMDAASFVCNAGNPDIEPLLTMISTIPKRIEWAKNLK